MAGISILAAAFIADSFPGSENRIHAVMALGAAVADIRNMIFGAKTSPFHYAPLYLLRHLV